MSKSIEQRILEESELIKKMEAEGNPHEFKTTEWYVWSTELRDAYWRRRMLIAKKDGLNANETAKVY